MKSDLIQKCIDLYKRADLDILGLILECDESMIEMRQTIDGPLTREIVKDFSSETFPEHEILSFLDTYVKSRTTHVFANMIRDGKIKNF